MLILASLGITMVSLIVWSIPNVIRCLGDEGIGPLALSQDETVLNKRYKIYQIWTTVGAVGCIVSLVLAYITCYWLT